MRRKVWMTFRPLSSACLNSNDAESEERAWGEAGILSRLQKQPYMTLRLTLSRPIGTYRGFARQPYCMAGQWNSFALERTFVPMGKRIYCSFHATWLPCKTSIDFTRSNARRFYSSMGNPLGRKGLKLDTSVFPMTSRITRINAKKSTGKTKSAICVKDVDLNCRVKR